MAALSASRNTPEWSGTTREHFALIGVEASTSIYVGGMVAVDASGNAVPAQALSGTSTLRKLHVVGICESVYAGGTVAPGLNALNQTGNGTLYPAATGTLGAAGAISVQVVTGIFGLDYDSTITSSTPVGQIVFAKDDHTVTLGTLVANTTSITVPSSGLLANFLSTPNIVPGTFDAYSATGAGGTHYKENTDFVVDYQAGVFYTMASAGISAGGTVYVTYYWAGTYVPAGMFYGLDGSQAYISFKRGALGIA
jgi:hypothetical protein